MIVLYTPGTGHKRDGVECQAKLFDEQSYLHNLDNGWFYSPADCYPETPKETEPEDAPIILVDEIPEDEVDPKPETVKKVVKKRKTKKK